MSSQKKFIFPNVSRVLMIHQSGGKRLNNVMVMSEEYRNQG